MTDVNPGSLFYFTLPTQDVEKATTFFTSLFGWDMHTSPNGVHVDGVYPPMGMNKTDGPGHPQVWIEVEDAEAAAKAVRDAGGTTEEVVTFDSGINVACVDDQGVHFNVIVGIEEYRQPARRSTETGELFYWTLPASDASRAKAFYRRCFGWEFSDPGNAGGMHIENKVPDGGLGGGQAGTHPDVYFRVANLDEAMAKVVDLGGRAEFAGEGDEGRHATCTDDQGTSFGISQPAEGY